jgi:hypothetical protein
MAKVQVVPDDSRVREGLCIHYSSQYEPEDIPLSGGGAAPRIGPG